MEQSMVDISRVCPKCGILKSSAYYYKNKSKKSGLGTYCKECYKEYHNKYKQEHLEEYLKNDNERQKKWYSLHKDEISERRHNSYPEHKEDSNRRGKEYYISNKAEIAFRRHIFHIKHKSELNAKSLEYHNSHKEYRLECSRQWTRNNPEKHRLQASLRRARKKNATIIGITHKEWLQMCKDNNGCCSYCGRKTALEMDHVIPLTKGGVHGVDNIVPACKKCNSSKHAEDLVMWLYRVSL
jgi:5-methylcytosine-specific restriction endonuclease McrA